MEQQQIKPTKDIHEITMIAACISETNFKKLYKYANQKNTCGYIGCLDTISEWSQEFYNQYYEQIGNWEDFEMSEANIYKSNSWDEFLIEWAYQRLNTYKLTDNGF